MWLVIYYSTTIEIAMIVTNVKRVLLNAFNIANHITPAVQMDDIDWLTPEVWLQGSCNSRVTIQTSAAATEYNGSETLYFNRRKAEEDLRGVKIPGKATDYTRVYQILTAMREILGIPVQNNEYLDQPFSGNTFTLNVTTISMAYLPGSSITLEFEE